MYKYVYSFEVRSSAWAKKITYWMKKKKNTNHSIYYVSMTPLLMVVFTAHP